MQALDDLEPDHAASVSKEALRLASSQNAFRMESANLILPRGMAAKNSCASCQESR
jgi:hypothetical protein